MEKKITAQEVIDYIESTGSASTAILKICCLDGLFQSQIYKGCSMDTSELYKLMEWLKKN